MFGSIKKAFKKTVGAAIGSAFGPLGGIVGYGTQKILENDAKKKAKEARMKADNAILTEELGRTNAAAKAFEAEQRKKEKRQMGLGSAISGSESYLG